MRDRTLIVRGIFVLSLAFAVAGAGAAVAREDTTAGAATEDPQFTYLGGSGPGGPCGGIAGYGCNEGLICIMPAGWCDYQDVLGTCAELPCQPTWEPVCGCDGVTYTNACFAHLLSDVNGPRVDFEGVCAADVPAASEVGTMALGLLLLIAGTALLVYRRSKKRT